MERAVLQGKLIGGRYRLGDRAHRDVFGEVFHAVDTNTDRAVAVRVLAADIGIAPGSSSTVLALSRGDRALRHPNLAAVLDVACERDRWFLVSEIAAGETLASLITRRGPLSPTDAFKLAIDLAEGLRALHHRGAFHGRLDPTRVVVAGDTARITDVGLGILLGDDSEEWRTTVPDMNDPTIAFLSPEQAAGDGPPTAESDVWGLGAVLYFAMFGSVPYAARTRAELAVATARRLVSLERARDRSLAALIAPCLSREPALRPLIGEFLDDARTAFDPAFDPNGDTSTPGASLSILNPEAFRPKSPVIAATERVPRPVIFGAIFAVFLLLGLVLRDGEKKPPVPTNAGLPALVTEYPRLIPSASASTSATTALSDAGTVAQPK